MLNPARVGDAESSPSVAIVGVAYDSPVESRQFLAHVAALFSPTVHAAVVVENGSVTTCDPGGDWPVHLLAPRNLGYFGGAAFGIEHLESTGRASDWYMITNVDIEIETPDLIAPLGAVGDEFGVVAPSVIEHPFGDTNPYKTQRPSRLRLAALEAALTTLWTNDLLNRAHRALRNPRARRRDGRGPSGRQVIYAPHGSVVFVRRELVVGTDFFGEAPFLYSEELFLAEEARRLGLGVLYVPELRMQHLGGVSTKKIDSRRRLAAEKDALTEMRKRYWQGRAPS